MEGQNHPIETDEWTNNCQTMFFAMKTPRFLLAAFLCQAVSTLATEVPRLDILQATNGALVSQTIVYPREIDDPLVNPYCGWGIWAGPRFYDSRQFSVEHNTKGFGDDAPLFSWVLIDWMWSDL